ncbi:uncharacterized protein LOC128557831 [Mercenaria mercenaria]|uniref:uncharacterized protein LOC128557831 n=1 Tax=Mercenaria mercenaria TaxID=6596 RepID=UPI00234F0577|nr:uncharacterized protein LOC128557831 [Mercenaria mercenaria]
MGSLWNQIRPIIGRPNRVNRFLYDIYKEEIAVDRQRSKAEIHDIGTAVNDMISAIVGQAFETDTVFNIPRKMLPNHIIGVGSFFEQTKIIDVNEFDFTVVLPYFTSENVRVVKELHSPYVGCRHGVRKNPFAFVELEYVGKNADILTKKNLLTTIKSKRYILACGLYTFAKVKIDDCLSGPRKVQPVDRETGTLEFNVNGFGSKSYPNGPALKLYLKWWQNWGHNNLDITVDLVPAIKTSIPKNMSNNITAPYVMRKEVTKSNCCFFIPKNKPHVSVDFIISFSQIESQLLLTLRKERP